MTTLIMDLEGDNFLHSITTIWCMGIADADDHRTVTTYSDYDPDCPPMSEGIARLKAAERVVGWNIIGYDWPVIEKFYPGTLTSDQLYDGMVMRGLLTPTVGSLSLEAVGREQNAPKGDFHDFSAYSNEMRVYMERDVLITGNEYHRQIKALIKWRESGVDFSRAARLEHTVQQPLALQMDHGFRIDVALCERLESELRGEVNDIEAEMLRLHGPLYRPEKALWDCKAKTWEHVTTFVPKADNRRHGYTAGCPMTKVKLEMFNPGSRQQIAYRLSRAYGWTPRAFTKAGAPKIDEEVLSTIEHPEAQVFARYLDATKKLGQLADGDNGWLKVHRNGRIHGYVRSNGCRTTRMSHSRPNTAQVNLALRACWLPDEGHLLVGVDADGLELRLLAAYLYSLDGGAYAEAVLTGRKESATDAHSLNQQAVGLYSRDSAKTFFYAMVYGASDAKLGSIVIDDARAAGKARPQGSLTKIGREARARLERGIRGLGTLVKAVKRRAQERGYVLLPDGRPVETPPRIALNSLLQGAGSVLMKQALARFHTVYYPDLEDVHYVANVHDEVQFSAPPALAEIVGQHFVDSIEQAGRDFDLPVPFTGEYKVGTSWAETH